MLYNVYINNGVAIKVTEYNTKCTPCNNMDAVDSDERRILKVDLPLGLKDYSRDFEYMKKYINLNIL